MARLVLKGLKSLEKRETEIVKECLQWLHSVGILAWRQNQGAMTASYKGKSRFIRFSGIDGISDILGACPDGRILAIEVKRPGSSPTPSQWEFLSRIQNTNGVSLWVSSVDELIVLLRQMGVCN